MVQLLLIVVISCATTTGSQCILPSPLINSHWVYRKDNTDQMIHFGVTNLNGLAIAGKGTKLSSFNCISNITGHVYVFKSTYSYSDRGDDRWIYRCIKFTQLSENLFYFYYLSDFGQNVSPVERVFNPPANQIPSDGQPTCSFCNFTTPINADEYILIRRQGTNESLTTVPTLCLPCESTCNIVINGKPFPELLWIIAPVLAAILVFFIVGVVVCWRIRCKKSNKQYTPTNQEKEESVNLQLTTGPDMKE